MPCFNCGGSGVRCCEFGADAGPIPQSSPYASVQPLHESKDKERFMPLGQWSIDPEVYRTVMRQRDDAVRRNAAALEVIAAMSDRMDKFRPNADPPFVYKVDVRDWLTQVVAALEGKNA